MFVLELFSLEVLLVEVHRYAITELQLVAHGTLKITYQYIAIKAYTVLIYIYIYLVKSDSSVRDLL